MNGWHEAWDETSGPDVVCGHLTLIAVPPSLADPADACKDCLVEGTDWVELRRCLVCGNTGCCESSARQHGLRHFEATGHPVIAYQTGGESWGWCYLDGFALKSDGTRWSAATGGMPWE